MTVLKRVEQGYLLPPFHGVAWIDYQRNQAVCAPVPFNLLIMLGRSIWIFVRHGHVALCQSPRDAYQQGLKAGKAEVLAALTAATLQGHP